MKAVILAGGFGTRLVEESSLRPKPMIEIGGMPLLVHIMKIYSHYGVTDFIVCLGYMGYYIREYFANFMLHRTDVTYDFKSGTVEYFNSVAEPWRVTLIDTGLNTMTGGRLKRVRHLLGDATFMMTYGDGVANLNLDALLDYHRRHGRAATLTAVRPPGRFGALQLDYVGRVEAFREKVEGEFGWVNGGFFALEPRAIDVIDGDMSVWEREPLEELAKAGELGAYHHHGFWQPVDSLREKMLLQEMWASGHPPWRIWD